MASPAALAAVLEEQQAQPPAQPAWQGAMFGLSNLARGLFNPAGFGMAMAPTVQRTAQGMVQPLVQANQAMPWGGNDPSAIGIDTQAGTIDPSVMVPFATNVAGMASTGSMAAPAVPGAAGMGIRAYHGSPHDFDRFSMDKIGTGEGAQATVASMPKRTLFHGTREQALDLTDDRPLFLTPQEAEAMGYARGEHLGGSSAGEPQVMRYEAADGKSINIDDKIFEAMDNGGDLIDALDSAIADAKAQGYRFVEYSHPSFDGSGPEQQVVVSLFPKSDLTSHRTGGRF